MDEFKPEDELKPDPSDRRTGRSRQSSERSERTERGEPQINFDDIELDDTDDRRPTRAQKARNEEPEIEEEIDESEDETVDEERVERRPRKRKKAASKPASRQYMMMGVGILVLLLLIIGIGSALKAPSTSSSDQTASGEKSIDLARQCDRSGQWRAASAGNHVCGKYSAGCFSAADLFYADSRANPGGNGWSTTC